MLIAHPLQCFGQATHVTWVQLVLLYLWYEGSTNKMEHTVYFTIGNIKAQIFVVTYLPSCVWFTILFHLINRYVYWGEYPLSFAACLGQEECYRLMLARGANSSNQDTNGNTVLHMLVIYEKIVSILRNYLSSYS